MDKTINNEFNKKQYQKFFQHFLETNEKGQVGGGSPIQRTSLVAKYLPVGRTILEIGSGGGNDALELQKKGYNVIASDYTQEFVDILRKKDLHTILLDAKYDDLPSNIDAIYANAVFVHFSVKELKQFLKKTKTTLQNEKIIFMSVLEGEGAERRISSSGFERDFQYFTIDIVRTICNECGYKILNQNNSDSRWLQLIIQVN